MWESVKATFIPSYRSAANRLSTLVSFRSDCAFVFCRRFNIVTFLYITNRYLRAVHNFFATAINYLVGSLV
jgi:hypothetical protein